MNTSNTQHRHSSPERVYIQPDDRPRFDRVAKIKGWTNTKTLSRILDHFIATDPQVGQHLDETA